MKYKPSKQVYMSHKKVILRFPTEKKRKEKKSNKED